MHQVRTRVLDHLTLTALREGASQIVVLGAGGDSRAYRFERELAGARVFEVDRPETSAWKQGRVRRMLGRLPENVRYVQVDFGAQALDTALERAGFDARERTFFLWEGVTMYLRPAAIDAVLSLVARTAEGSAVAFDYIDAEAIAHPERFEGATVLTSHVASRGEPFTFGMPPQPEPLSAFLRTRSLEVVETWNQEKLRAIYPGPGFLVPYFGIVHARSAPSA